MNLYEVRYRLYHRARRNDRLVKVKADNAVQAAAKVSLSVWKYPFHIVSVFPVMPR